MLAVSTVIVEEFQPTWRESSFPPDFGDLRKQQDQNRNNCLIL
jgi:hypothetical protein